MHYGPKECKQSIFHTARLYFIRSKNFVASWKMAAMERRIQLNDDTLAQKKDLKKRVHSGKRFSYGKTVQFPGIKV